MLLLVGGTVLVVGKIMEAELVTVYHPTAIHRLFLVLPIIGVSMTVATVSKPVHNHQKPLQTQQLLTMVKEKNQNQQIHNY